MEEILKQTLLYDFYGELLTEHQKQVYEDVILNDYSLSEVAASLGISRQGVHDMVRRSNRLLEEYEAKLHLMERFVSLREKVGEIHKLCGRNRHKIQRWRRSTRSHRKFWRSFRWHLTAYRKKLQNVFKNLRSKGRLTEADVKAALKGSQACTSGSRRQLQSRKTVYQRL